ncbi:MULTISPECIES: hypothetical protein [Halolamina]|uniref:Uncharacterized protein n=1 Tax=Halolamina pelagica TaxID=699431 RepID=A0A1I5U9J2_9EURY|nr:MULTISPECIES: hypothetical protein [Halolamina]NHX37191.1 hypothetical protein [Halolamina sp. R1-12]SFP91930.1 hypothetical protein SAMN05216277_11218 [Halolamina pelagica]
MSKHDSSPEAVYKLSTSVSPPREPSAYRITDHFRYRMNHRQNPSVDGDIIRRCFEDGRIKNTAQADRFIFELDADHRWWLIVELRDEAFFQESEKHRALTVFAKGSDHDAEGWSV